MKAFARLSVLVAGVVLALACAAVPAAAEPELPNGFRDTTVLSELPEPTTMRFAPDGRVFVAEKAGKIVVYENIDDTTPEVFADLRTEVYDAGDRGLLGLALDPNFASNHFVYALYTYDHILGGVGPEEGKVPRWGEPNHSGDECPKPSGSGVDDCPVSGRLVRLTAEGDHAAPSADAPAEKVLLEDWCQQFSSHSIGDLQFGPEGALYVSGGDGASFNNADYGQFGWPRKNMCGDPPGGESLQPPTAEGGALRSQDIRTQADPTGLNGTIVRIDPSTGTAWPGNPNSASLEANVRRIVAYGFRNPFRFTIDPGDGEIYVGNVGWDTFEEIDRVPAVGSLPVFNSGWPCYEGPEPNPIYAGLELNLCKSLYAEGGGATAQPLFYYRHYENVVPEETCASGTGSAIAGLAFYPGGPFPAAYDGALFFADPVRSCIWVMFPGDDGRPDPLTTSTFMAAGGLYPGVDLELGPEGNLFYVKVFGGTEEGTIHKISYDPEAPVARLTADKRWGPKPLEVHLDASGSTAPSGEPLSFEWDFDGNGSFEESGDSEEVANYDVTHNVNVGVRVSDGSHSSVAHLELFPDDSPPEPQIEAPTAALSWGVGQQIDFSGSAADPEEIALPPSDLYWKTRLLHCPAACHAHPLRVFPGVAAGSFLAPDHDYPSHIEIILTATDERGLTATESVTIDPRPFELEIASEPAGIQLSAGEETAVAPFPLTAIEGGSISLSAPATAEVGGVTYYWTEWSDEGARAHTIQAETASTYKAVYSTEPPGPEEEGEEEPPGEEDSGGEGAGAESPRTGPPPATNPPPSTVVSPVAPRSPQTSIHRHPPKRTHSARAKFTFSASQRGARFRCKLDGRPFHACHSPQVYRRLKPGKHVFRVAAVGRRRDPTPSVFRWKVL